MTTDTEITPDAADQLAKEIIGRLCDTTNKFMKDRVRLPFMQNPMSGFQLPFKPLAHQIRECAKKLFTIPEATPPGDHLTDWFGGEMAETPSQPQPAALTVESITAALAGGKLRLKELAQKLNAEPEAVAAIIATEDSGLTVSGPAKWVAAV